MYKNGDVVLSECVGCGKVQEHFLGCADISIRDVLAVTTKAPKKTSLRPRPKINAESRCVRKLEFGSYLDFNNIGDIFCQSICGIECPLLKEQVKENLMNGIVNEPDDLITCLDTCQKMCACS